MQAYGSTQVRPRRLDLGMVAAALCLTVALCAQSGHAEAGKRDRQRVTTTGKAKAGPNPVVRDHRGRGTVGTNPNPLRHRKCRGWEGNCWPAGTRDHRK